MLMSPNESAWFEGVVEDRMDPLKQGRVRVRVIGVHPFKRIQDDIEGMPVEDLPWMSVMLPVTSAGVSGVGGSNTGLVEGSHVTGVWRDKYKTNGIVLGVITGIMTEKPNPNEGFSDPNGVYPSYIGNDTGGLGIGGISGGDDGSIKLQNNNLGVGINPDPNGPDGDNPDNNPTYPVRAMITADEGQKTQLYEDSLGYPTIGIGHLVLYKKNASKAEAAAALSKELGRNVPANAVRITEEEMQDLFEKDLAQVQSAIKKNSTVAPVYAKLNRSRQMALENMAFQLNVGGLAKFKTSLALIAAGDWQNAYKQMLNSLWARQTPQRAIRVARVILTGNLSSYGQPAPKKSGKMLIQADALIDDTNDEELTWDSDFSVPPPPKDPNILFEEPKNSYKGEYPYVHSHVTESGLVQEFDDTPNQSRYRLQHPSGSYTEMAPDGRVTQKSFGDYYDLTNGSRNMLTGSDLNVNVAGDETYYNMGSVDQTINGTRTVVVRGDEILQVQGNGTIKVQGNIQVIVEGNADIQVNGNADTKVQGDHNLNVSGNLTWTVGGNVTQNVGGTYSQTMSSMISTSSGAYKIDGSRIDLG